MGYKFTTNNGRKVKVIMKEPFLESWQTKPPADCRCCFNCKHWHVKEYTHCQHSGPWGGDIKNDKNCVFTWRATPAS